MPKPATVNELISAIRRTQAIDGKRLDTYFARHKHTNTLAIFDSSPHELLSRLIDDGLLTQFQADAIATGMTDCLRVGGYRILDKIGAGGMGSVFLGEAADGRRYAVKILEGKLSGDPVARHRFAREAWATGTLAHPNIVRVVEVHPEAYPPYFVMEYADGLTLQAAVARGGTFSAGTAAHCGCEIAHGLHRAAEAGMVHRDIKPANLVMVAEGRVKILDLGIVRIPGLGDLTRRLDVGKILGTADYIAPEQSVNSSDVDIRADIYSLGATLYFTLAGHPPFPNGSADEKLSRKQREDPARIDRLRPDVPAGLALVIQKMLARRPGDRYQTPAEVVEALSPYANLPPGFPGKLLAKRGASDGDPHPVTADDLPPTGSHTAVPPPGNTDQAPAVPMAVSQPAATERTVPVTRAKVIDALGWAVGLMVLAGVALVVGVVRSAELW